LAKAPKPRRIQTLSKAPTGIAGLDAVTQGGLPRGRPTLVSGRAGCGKTVLGLEFVVRGAVEFEEPGLIVSFEESAEELTANVRSLGFDLDDLCARKKLAVEFVSVERHEIEETGDYNLDGLFVRLGHAIDSLGAKRMLLDTIEALFAGLTNLGILRAELRRLFRWLKSKGVTVVLTGEGSDELLAGYGKYLRLAWNWRAGAVYERMVPMALRSAVASSVVPRLPAAVGRYARRSFLAMERTPETSPEETPSPRYVASLAMGLAEVASREARSIIARPSRGCSLLRTPRRE